MPKDVPLRRKVQLSVEGEQRLASPGPVPVARDVHRPQQCLQCARAGPLVRPLDTVGADHGRGGRRLRPRVEMRLQQLPHQLPPLLLQQGFEIAVGHARR